MASSLADSTVVSCPKCGGRMWDNRATKKNPKQPDFKCQNRSCDGVIWPPKNAAAATPAAPPAVAETTGDKPKLTEIYMTASKFVTDKIVPLYVEAEIGCSDQAVAAMVATLFIAATKER